MKLSLRQDILNSRRKQLTNILPSACRQNLYWPQSKVQLVNLTFAMVWGYFSCCMLGTECNLFPFLSTALSIPGNQTFSLSNALVLTIPWCPGCAMSIIFSVNEWGITIRVSFNNISPSSVSILVSCSCICLSEINQSFSWVFSFSTSSFFQRFWLRILKISCNALSFFLWFSWFCLEELVFELI